MTSAPGSKAYAIRLALFAVIFPTGAGLAMRCALGYWVQIDGVWWQVPEGAITRNAGNPLGEAVVWYVSIRGNIVIRCFVPADAS